MRYSILASEMTFSLQEGLPLHKFLNWQDLGGGGVQYLSRGKGMLRCIEVVVILVLKCLLGAWLGPYVFGCSLIEVSNFV